MILWFLVPIIENRKDLERSDLQRRSRILLWSMLNEFEMPIGNAERIATTHENLELKMEVEL